MAENSVTKERVQIHSHVERTVARELAALAREHDRSISAEIRRALGAYVERERDQDAARAERSR